MHHERSEARDLDGPRPQHPEVYHGHHLGNRQIDHNNGMGASITLALREIVYYTCQPEIRHLVHSLELFSSGKEDEKPNRRKRFKDMEIAGDVEGEWYGEGCTPLE